MHKNGNIHKKQIRWKARRKQSRKINMNVRNKVPTPVTLQCVKLCYSLNFSWKMLSKANSQWCRFFFVAHKLWKSIQKFRLTSATQNPCDIEVHTKKLVSIKCSARNFIPLTMYVQTADIIVASCYLHQWQTLHIDLFLFCQLMLLLLWKELLIFSFISSISIICTSKAHENRFMVHINRERESSNNTGQSAW